MPRIVKRITIRTLPEDFSYNDFFARAMPTPADKIKLPKDHCVMTACNNKHFIGFQLLYSSLYLSHQVEVVLIDLGMTSKQRDWCRRQKRLTVLRYNFKHPRVFYWQAWCKPLYLLKCPFRYVIWMDADGLWKGNLLSIMEMAKQYPLFTADYTHDPKNTLNWPELYHWLPIPNFKKDEYPYINTGFFIIDRVRDRTLIQEWCYIVMEALYSEHIKDSIACWDQGACKWALQELGLTHTIYNNVNFNHPAIDREQCYPAVKEAVLQLIHNVWTLKDACFVHWMGQKKPWLKWGEVLNLDFSLSL